MGRLTPYVILRLRVGRFRAHDMPVMHAGQPKAHHTRTRAHWETGHKRSTRVPLVKQGGQDSGLMGDGKRVWRTQAIDAGHAGEETRASDPTRTAQGSSMSGKAAQGPQQVTKHVHI